MQLEWSWLRRRDRAQVEGNEIILEGSAPVRVLLLHGLTGTPMEFAYIAHYVRQRAGVSVECRRLVNHGQPMVILGRTSWQELLASAEEHFARALDAARSNGEQLVVGGLSLGAVLALDLAARHPGDVAGVIALSPTLFYDGWSVPWTRRLIGLADYLPIKHMLFMREQPPYGLKDETLRARMAAVYAGTAVDDDSRAAELGYAHFPVSLFCEMRHIIRRCIAALPQVRAPLLILQARDDEVTSPRNAQFIYDRVASQDKEIVLLDNSYHVITADLDRERVAATMVAFCRNVIQRVHACAT